MSSYAPITIHESQWPAALAAQLRDSFKSGRINHKFHYESPRQVRQWLRLHDVYSPARQQADFRATYEPAFGAVLDQLGPAAVHLIGLGCGGGQKEAALLGRLASAGRSIVFSATDVSVGMVVTSLQAAWKQIEPARCSGLVCDLVGAQGLAEFFGPQSRPGARRVVTFFGMIPNFEPGAITNLLQHLLRPGDLLLCSANLAPGADYRRGVEQVLPQYDNAMTREWLGMLQQDCGISRDSGTIQFHVEEKPAGGGVLRIAATFRFLVDATAVVEGEAFRFDAGSSLGLFFSYRHTPHTLGELLAASSLKLEESWISSSGEEGVFLASMEGKQGNR